MVHVYNRRGEKAVVVEMRTVVNPQLYFYLDDDKSIFPTQVCSQKVARSFYKGDKFHLTDYGHDVIFTRS